MVLPRIIPTPTPPPRRDSHIRDLRGRSSGSARWPADWPGPGPIDRGLQDLPHASSASEWWYLNTHFELSDGRACSLFAAFFRIVSAKDELTGELTHAHSVVWALTDATRGRYHAESLVDRRAPEIGLKRLAETPSKDPRMDRALKEVLLKGQVPAPDRMLERDAFVGQRRLELDFDGRTLRKDDDGRYHLKLAHASEAVAVELVLDPRKPPIRHGDDGVVRGADGEYMFYYFIPRCGLTGRGVWISQFQNLIRRQKWHPAYSYPTNSLRPLWTFSSRTALTSTIFLTLARTRKNCLRSSRDMTGWRFAPRPRRLKKSSMQRRN